MPKPPANTALGMRIAARRKILGERRGRDFPMEELANLVGMKQQGINSIEKGEVKRPKKLREIARALQTSEDWLLEGNGPEEVKPEDEGVEVMHVPLLDWVTAGKAVEAAFAPQDVPLLAFADLGRGDFFALKVEGDSMDRISPEGSVIVVNRADRQLVSGRYYVFSIKGKTTYKAWHGGTPSYLKPFSTSSHDPIFFREKDLEVVGRVCRTVLDL